MIKAISKEAWHIISKGKKYLLYADLRLLIGCIDYLIDNRIYRVKVI